MDNYIVRIYRQEENNPRKVVGVMEEVGVKGKRAFSDVDELWEILSAQNGGSRGKQRSGTQENKAAKCGTEHA